MRNWKPGLIVIAIFIILIQSIFIDYRDLSWAQNAGGYLVILSMLAVIVSAILNKQRENQT
jgi:hypothetical protein